MYQSAEVTRATFLGGKNGPGRGSVADKRARIRIYSHGKNGGIPGPEVRAETQPPIRAEGKTRSNGHGKNCYDSAVEGRFTEEYTGLAPCLAL